MRVQLIFPFIALIALLPAAIIGCQKARDAEPASENSKNMKITSPAFGHNQPIPAKYTCDGENINPPLHITEIPADAVSLALIADDPDAPGSAWVHWVVYNISPLYGEIPENSVPPGATLGITDFGIQGYGGPCPPSGEHRYFFKAYALDAPVKAPLSASKEDIEKAIEGHILAQAELVGLYEKE